MDRFLTAAGVVALGTERARLTPGCGLGLRAGGGDTRGSSMELAGGESGSAFDVLGSRVCVH